MRRTNRNKSFQLQKIQDLLPPLEEQIKAVRNDPEVGPQQKARTLERLTTIALKVKETAEVEGRMEAVEAIVKQRKQGKSNERDGLARFYPGVTPRERLDLVLDALARGDAQEIRRLAEACPPPADRQYLELYDASCLAAMVFAGVWLEAHRTFCLALGFARGAQAAWTVAGKEGPIPEQVLEEPCDLVQLAIGRLKGVHRGLLRFCQAARIEPKKLLTWCPDLLTEIEETRHLLDSPIPTNQNWARATYRALCAIWPGLEPPTDRSPSGGLA